MYLERLDIEDFRCIASERIDSFNRINIFYGNNGSGKTSLIEAIYMTAMAKSFRGARPRDLIKAGRERACVAVQYKDTSGLVRIGLERTGTVLKMQCNGTVVGNISQLARILPIVFLSPDTPMEFFSCPRTRRRLLDFLLFHVEPSYLDCYRKFLRCIKNRNAMLRQGRCAAEVTCWDPKLLESATRIDQLRTGCLSRLEEVAGRMADALLGRSLDIRYLKGWPSVHGSYAQALEVSIGGDQEVGFTRSGPHRADLEVKLDGISAKERCSRGQTKLVVAALYIAQAMLIRDATGRSPLILVDDLISDLDGESRSALLRVMEETELQLFITAIEPSVIPVHGAKVTTFHVEQGRFKQAA